MAQLDPLFVVSAILGLGVAMTLAVKAGRYAARLLLRASREK